MFRFVLVRSFMLASMEKCDSMILKLDDILQKDPGFGGVIPRFLGKYLSTDDFSCVIIFRSIVK